MGKNKFKYKVKSFFKNLSITNFLFLFLAGVVNSIGVTLFLAPVQLYDSGISGTSMLLWQLTPDKYTLSLFLIILNVPLFLFGLKKQGAAFTVYSIFTVLIYSATSYIINYILPIDNMKFLPVCGKGFIALRNIRRNNLRRRKRTGNQIRRRNGRD